VGGRRIAGGRADAAAADDGPLASAAVAPATPPAVLHGAKITARSTLLPPPPPSRVRTGFPWTPLFLSCHLLGVIMVLVGRRYVIGLSSSTQ
jgi:hypothetical protein